MCHIPRPQKLKLARMLTSKSHSHCIINIEIIEGVKCPPLHTDLWTVLSVLRCLSTLPFHIIPSVKTNLCLCTQNTEDLTQKYVNWDRPYNFFLGPHLKFLLTKGKARRRDRKCHNIFAKVSINNDKSNKKRNKRHKE